MVEERILKRLMLARIEGTKIWGRLRSRWLDKVMKDLQQMGVRNWRNIVKEWNEWRRIV